MENKRIEYPFLILSLLGMTVFMFFILRPFLYIVILSLVCAIVFWPIHEKINYLLGSWHRLAALVTIIIIIIVILCPLIFLGMQIFQEVQHAYVFLIEDRARNTIISMVDQLAGQVQQFAPFMQKFSIDIDRYIAQWVAWLPARVGSIFGNIVKLIFDFFIFLIVTYYALKDGPKFKNFIMTVSPLADDNNRAIFQKVKIAVNSVVKGSLVIALAQGVLAGAAFAFLGIPSAMLWAAATTVAALIPGVGTALVLFPAIIFVFFAKGILPALGLLAWGVVVVGLIDNLLRPQLIGQGMKIHPLIIFLSALGGIVLLGPVGFLLGPLAISLLFAMLDIYLYLVRQDAQEASPL